MSPNIKKQRNSIFQILVGLIIIASFGTGFLIGRDSSIGSDILSLDIPNVFLAEELNFSLIENVWELLHEEYVDADNLNEDALIKGAIRGMVEALEDPYSVFFDRDETREFLQSVNGKFEGVGIEITLRDGDLIIVSPLKDSPAQRAGARAGDKIIKIDGASTQDITIEKAVSKIRGTKGTSVILTVRRSAESLEIDLHIIRETIEIPSVRLEILPDTSVAYIELITFSESTAKDFSLLVREILNSDADRIILDLRNNPGGYLDAAVDVTGWFLPDGSLVVTEELGDGRMRKHISSGPSTLENFPLVLLLNEGSASASEIVAGALRDNRNIPIIGTRSFGKGTVQSFENLSGGTSLKLTIARWLTPSGVQINKIGIEPTIEVEITEEDLEEDIDTQYDRAIEIILDL